jgi:O-antigen/teichoic acid export membrane protein
VGCVLYVPAMLGLRPSLRGWRRPLGFGGWLTGASIAGNIGGQAAELITGRVLGLASTALYSRALGIAGLVRTLFYATVTQPALPALVRAGREEAGGMVRVYLRFVAVITGLSWPAYAALAFWAEPITVMLYGEQWRPAAAVLPTVCIASILVLAATPYHQALMASQRVRLFFLCETGLLLNWLALLLVATPLGLQAVAWAYVAGTLVGAVVYVIALRLAIGLRLRDLAAVWWRSGVPALAVGVVAALMRLSPLATAWPLPFVLLLTGVLGGSVWLGAIWLVRHEFRDHAIDLLRWGWARLRTIRP